MFCRNSSASSRSISEQQSTSHAVMALLQQQHNLGRLQETQSEDLRRSSITSRSVTSVSPGEDKSTSPPYTSSRTWTPRSFGKAQLPQTQNEDPEGDAHADTPKNLDSADSPFGSLATLGPSHATKIDTIQQSRHQVSDAESTDGTNMPREQNFDRPSTSTRTEKNDHPHQLPPSGQSPSQIQATASSSKATAESGNVELQMFLLKPEISDSSQMIELYWTVRDTNMQQSEIRKQLAKYEHENLPPLLEMLETLHSDEHYAIDDLISQCNGALDESRSQLIALKRTKMNISFRDMVFQGVPGLQFIIQQVRSQNRSVRDSIRDLRRRRTEWNFNRRRLRPYADNYDHDYSDEDRRSTINGGGYYMEREVRPRHFYDLEKETEAREQYKEELLLKDAKETKGNEEDEPTIIVDEVQVVADLLGKYTTLYGED